MYRNEKLRRAIASMRCVECGASDCQHAHANTPPFGKGKGIKAHDWAGFPLCVDKPGHVGHHTKHDLNLAGLSKTERIDLEAMYIARTLGQLIEDGVLIVK